MNKKILLYIVFVASMWSIYTGFSPNDENPRWSNHPSTRIDLNPQGNYMELPAGFESNYSNETQYYSTPQGIFSVGPNFRVHPTTARTQSETPITRHPQNPNIMFASANTFNVGGTTTFSCGHYVTTDGGVTWFGDDTTVFNFGDPAPMIMHTGRMLISFITSTGNMGASYSVDNGANWSGIVTFPGSTGSSDKNLSAVDGTPTSAFYGRCYTVYTEFGGSNANRIVSSWSSDGGVSWSSITPVSPPPSSGHHHQGCDVTVDIYGWVRVVWANCISNGQNSTEDSLGWAESSNGGVTWSDQSNHKVNINGIRTSDLLTPSNVAIRANGFPRIDGDKSCSPTADDEYVVIAEKNFAPALDNADIVLNKTLDGGTTWTRVRVNQNPAGSYEWFPAVNVDETGGINICYYSTRNVPTNDSAEIYLSRSTDGGATFVDVKVSDHKFKPVPISGTATGYQGDYIGITAGGAGKILPYWCEQGPASGGRYQAWTALVDVSIAAPCDDFSCAKDTGTSTLGLRTGSFFEEFSGNNYWRRRNTASAYSIGSGSGFFNSWSASGGTVQSLVSYNFNAAAGSTYLTFDHAYAPWTGGNVDSLIIQTSTNGGTSYTTLTNLWGGLGAQAGPLNTVFVGGGQFTPTGGQWRPKIFLLPVGTNKIKLRAVSGFGNNIWIDNVCVKVLPAPADLTVGLASQGMWINVDPYWRLEDSIRVYLARTDFPNVIVDSAINTMGGNAVINDLFYNKALTGDYYRVIRHRNSIETWSFEGVDYTRGATSHFNFITPEGQAYGNNQARVSVIPLYRGMFSGDVDRDNSVDLTDVSIIENAAFNYLTGYVVQDLTGDNFVDLVDQTIADNNSFNFVVRVAPPGAVLTDEPYYPDEGNPVFENDAQRKKYELTKEFKNQQMQKKQNEKPEQEIGLSKERIDSYNRHKEMRLKDLSPTNENLDILMNKSKEKTGDSHVPEKLAGEK